MTARSLALASLVALAALAAAVLAPVLAAGAGKSSTKVVLSLEFPAFHGKLTSPRHACLGNRTVRMFRKHGGKTVPLGHGRSNDSGAWKVPAGANLIAGAYFATVAKRGECGAARSASLRIAAGRGNKVLTVGSYAHYPPFEESGRGKRGFRGFDVDLMRAVARAIGRKAEFRDTAFETIFRDLARGRFEVVASGATITPEREKRVDFTDPYYLSELAILVKNGSAIDSVERLSGTAIAVRQNTAGQEFVENEVEAGALRPFPNDSGAVGAVRSGLSDAAVIGYPFAENAVERSSGIEISATIPVEEDTYGFAVAQNDKGLLKKLNRGLRKLKRSGAYARIYRKWFHKAPPQSILTATHGAT